MMAICVDFLHGAQLVFTGIPCSGVTTAPANPASGGGGILGGRQVAAPEQTSTPSRFKTCRLTSNYQVYFKLVIQDYSKIRHYGPTWVYVSSKIFPCV